MIEDNSRALGSYRYGYQGFYSEEDEKTSWHSFELRQYDSDIGRWLSIDPYGQYHSPYVAMGNAPNMMVDADGGWSWTTAAIGAAVGVGVGYVASGGDWRYALAGGLAGGTISGASFRKVPTYGLGGSEAGSLGGISGYRTVPTKFGTSFLRTSLDIATAGTRYLANSSNSNPRIYFNITNYGQPEGFDKKEYLNNVRIILNENSFNPNIEFKDYSIWNNFLSWWNNDTYANIKLRSPSGVNELYQGGHAPYYSNNATVLYVDQFSIFDYANVTVHELGHAVFGFKDLNNNKYKGNLMFHSVQYGKRPSFDTAQKKVISNTLWGR